MSSQAPSKIRRYSGNERLNHWFTAITFILLTMSGLAFFHPAFWPMVAVLGGGEMARYLHPIIGVAMFVSFLIFAIQKLRDNLLSKVDGQWLAQIGDVLSNRDERLPEVGKYNAGQKLAYWAMVLSMLALLASGLVIWEQFFSYMFTVDQIRNAVVVHAVSAIVLILTIIVHVYAAIWVKGSISAMVSGYVSKAWARHHHALWYKSVSK